MHSRESNCKFQFRTYIVLLTINIVLIDLIKVHFCVFVAVESDSTSQDSLFELALEKSIVLTYLIRYTSACLIVVESDGMQ